jgi:serine/threonine protein kinase
MDPNRSTLIIPTQAVRRRTDGGWTLAGRYRIGQVIGRGGMSTVYRAIDTVLDREVAVKVLLSTLAEGDPVHVARFEREARAAAALRHPAVVKVYDTGVDGRTHFIVMEHVAGRSLDHVLRPGRPLEPEEATRIAAQVAGALAAAHAVGILHRDVKAANVMVTHAGEVKVFDFGIARTRQDQTLTQPAFAIGTAAYMSPERVNGLPGDERSDIYSLGCLLYAMLTGRPPFVADDVLSVLHQQVHESPVPPSRRGAAIAPPLDALVVGMLAKDPDARPASAAELAGRLADGAWPPAATAAGSISHHRSGRRGHSLAGLVLLAALVLVAVLLASGSGRSRLGVAAAASHRRTEAHTRSTSRHATPGQTVVPVDAPSIPQQAHPVPPGHGGTPPGHGGTPPGHQDKGPHAGGPPSPAGQNGQGDGGDG